MAGPITTRLISRVTVAPDVLDATFEVVSPPSLQFAAGQFVTLAVGHDPAGQALRRSYSIASSSGSPALRLWVRATPGGSSWGFFTALHEGQEVRMTGPHGFFVLLDRHPGDVIFAATGTGIAPVLPMLREIAARQEPGRRLVYWGVRREADLLVREEIEATCEATAASLLIHLSQPSDGWSGRRGRITPAVLSDLPTYSAPTFYLVGNGAMIAELKAGLVAAGIDRKRQIRTEAFFD
jgi:CDP-4-dehydro-6-deoxyglucose reductase